MIAKTFELNYKDTTYFMHKIELVALSKLALLGKSAFMTFDYR
jgi:hypothetical protein